MDLQKAQKEAFYQNLTGTDTPDLLLILLVLPLALLWFSLLQQRFNEVSPDPCPLLHSVSLALVPFS